MASDVEICNLALQKLGAAAIQDLIEDSRNARACNRCYTYLRDKELRAHKWNFATTRVVLAPLSTAPAFDYQYAFQLPSDCLRPLPPNDNNLDWKIEGKTILTNDGSTLRLVYIRQVTDANVFDVTFIDALAARVAYNICEEITQSEQKKNGLAQQYKDAIGEAKKANAFESTSDVPPVDPWLTAML